MSTRRRALRLLLALGLLATWAPASHAGEDAPPKGAEEIERYPASFRQKVQESIAAGVRHLRTLQRTTGHWTDPTIDQALGHTALPLLTLLKAGTPKDDPQVRLAFDALHRMKLEQTYGVALFLMVIQARYQPTLDTLDTDVGTERHERVKPKEVFKLLEKRDRLALEAGVAWLVRAQTSGGLWNYTLPADASGHDLSNSQYALLGLRAALDCGVSVPGDLWRDALAALVEHQDAKGPDVDLLEERVRGRYVFRSTLPAMARGFHYGDSRLDGPMGKGTLWSHPATCSMTTAGVASVAICAEGLWRSRRFSGAERRRAADAVQDGLAWMQENFSVTRNVGHPDNAHVLYYLYGLERMGMLAGRRWIGSHDWYKLGADRLLETQDARRGGWGNHVPTSYAVLFLKRATRRAETVVTTGD